MRMTVLVDLDDGRTVFDTARLDRVNDDYFQQVAAGMAYGLVEEVWGLMGDEGDEW